MIQIGDENKESDCEERWNNCEAENECFLHVIFLKVILYGQHNIYHNILKMLWKDYPLVR